MPAKDKYHDTVIHALQKAGWRVIKEQVELILENRLLWIDLQVQRNDEIRLVEVKSFWNVLSDVEYFASVIGKYIIYSTGLEYLGVELPLYLAVPDYAQDGFLQEAIAQQVNRKTDMKRLVFDPIQEEITLWQP